MSRFSNLFQPPKESITEIKAVDPIENVVEVPLVEETSSDEEPVKKVSSWKKYEKKYYS